MNRMDLSSDQIVPFICGALDVVFAFSIALERRGLLTRAEIVETLRAAQVQIEAQDGPQPTARAGVVDLMLKAFDMPVDGEQARSRFTVIDGGK
ncbi:MAG TPA: hypothetical protein VGM07_05170 [Stellaceae bacterium]|jgi:hypothetical protein